MRLEVPAGAYTGAASLTMAVGTDIPLEALQNEGQPLIAVSPPAEFGPAGTQFAKPVTISLPFSSQVYNEAAAEGKQIDVLHQTADGAVAGFDVGPIGLSTIGFDVGPIGFDVGPIGIYANEGNVANDLVITFQTTHFSTFQVVLVGEEEITGTFDECPCEEQGQICNSQKQCVACAGWEQVAGGDYYTCGLYDLGTKTELYCWGHDVAYALGTGQHPARNAPKVAVSEDNNKDWRYVAGGQDHTCAIDVDQNLYCWGSNAHGKVAGPPQQTNVNFRFPNLVGQEQGLRFESVSLGWYHSCGIDKTQKLWCWGSSEKGQLGLGYKGSTAFKTKPFEVTVTGPNKKWMTVAAGAQHTCAITEDELLFCWGANDLGQVEAGLESAGVPKPQRIKDKGAHRFKRVTTGLEHTCAITSGNCDANATECDDEGTLYCWGGNGYGQLGIGQEGGQASITAVEGGFKWRELDAGTYHTCGIAKTEDDKGLWCWGSNASLQLQVSGELVPKANAPIYVGADREWTQLTSGVGHFCGLVTDEQGQRLLCAGDNSNGQLGVTKDMMAIDNSYNPIPVCPPSEGVCTPVCAPGTCGQDGCGGTCECSANQQCNAGFCESSNIGPMVGIDQCKSNEDQSLLKTGDLLEFLETCVAVDCSVVGASDASACVSPCLEADEFSSGCAGCFEDLVVCAYENCASECETDPALASWSCDLGCLTSSGCFDAMNSCTGLCGDGICQTGVESKGTCSKDCSDGLPMPCIPECAPGTCGSDGCGGTCTCDQGPCVDGLCTKSLCDYKGAKVICPAPASSVVATVNDEGMLVLGLVPDLGEAGVFSIDFSIPQAVDALGEYGVYEVNGDTCGASVPGALLSVGDPMLSLEFDFEPGKKYVLKLYVMQPPGTNITVSVQVADCYL